MAYCWEEADNLPTEIAELFSASADFERQTPDLLFAIPEYKVALPGGSRASQNDLFALLRCADKTICMTVEGKVNEPFGPTIGEWLSTPTKGKKTRLEFLKKLLSLPETLPDGLHYQLLHRAASAAIEARRFKTDAAAMIVHSFSPKKMWFEAYALFLDLLGAPDTSGDLVSVRLSDGVPLYLGWAVGDQKFLNA